jgi:hypothetical protein
MIDFCTRRTASDAISLAIGLWDGVDRERRGRRRAARRPRRPRSGCRAALPFVIDGSKEKKAIGRVFGNEIRVAEVSRLR